MLAIATANVGMYKNANLGGPLRRDGIRAKHDTSIPKGDTLLPSMDTAVLREMHA